MDKNIFRVSKNEKKLVWGKEDWVVFKQNNYFEIIKLIFRTSCYA
jgi:hypothetical protein